MVNNSPLYAGEALDVIDLRQKETEVEAFWFEEWMPGGIILKDSQQVKGYPLRYDLYSQSLEIRTPTDVKVLAARQVQVFYLQAGETTHFFADLPAYLGIPPHPEQDNVAKILHEGQYVLIQRKERELLKANYVPALDAGSINDKIIFVDAYYLYDGQSLERLPRSKGKLRTFLAGKGIEVADFLKEAKIHPKKPEDLIRLCQYLDSLGAAGE